MQQIDLLTDVFPCSFIIQFFVACLTIVFCQMHSLSFNYSNLDPTVYTWVSHFFSLEQLVELCTMGRILSRCFLLDHQESANLVLFLYIRVYKTLHDFRMNAAS